VKGEHYAGESHNMPGGANGTESTPNLCDMCDSPIDEGGHPSALEAYCECYQNRGGAGLGKKVHCSSHDRRASPEANSVPLYAGAMRDGLPRTAQLTTALCRGIAFHTAIAFAAIVVSQADTEQDHLPARAGGKCPLPKAHRSPRPPAPLIAITSVG
jgi:hypothetical protein